MPYLLLILGLVVAAYALYRFFLRASVKEIKAFGMVAVSFVIIIAIFVMAVTGRLPAALALVVALVPFVTKLLPKKEAQVNGDKVALTRAEAYEILGLTESASDADIKSSYKKLMKKVHPDQEGSQWMAAKLNAAKDLLLDE